MSCAPCAARVVGGGSGPRSSPLAAAAPGPRALPTGGARLGLSRRASWPLPGRVAGQGWGATSESHVRAWSFLPCPARPGSCGNSSPGRGALAPRATAVGLCALEATLGSIQCVAVEGYPPHQTPYTSPPPCGLSKGDWKLPLTFPLACHKIAKRDGCNNF